MIRETLKSVRSQFPCSFFFLSFFLSLSVVHLSGPPRTARLKRRDFLLIVHCARARRMRVSRLICARFLYFRMLLGRDHGRALDCAVSQLGRAGKKMAFVVGACAANNIARRVRVRNCRRCLSGAGERRVPPNRTFFCLDCQCGAVVDDNVLLRCVQCAHHYPRV